MELFLLKIPNTIDNIKFNALLSLVEGVKQVRILKFLRDVDKYRTLLGDILIRHFLIATLKIDNREIEFDTNQYHKPYLKNNDAFYFNISHSGNWIVLAVDSKEIGVDIEFMRQIDYSLINVVFSDIEMEFFKKLPEGKKLSTFYKIWTYKESFIKASGEGLTKNMKKYSCIPTSNNTILTLLDENKSYYLKQYDNIPDYKMSVCALHRNFSETLQFKTFDVLYNEIMALSG